MANPHPYEIAFLVVSAVSVICSVSLFVLKMSDVLLVKHSGTNGVLAFSTTEKARRQGFMLTITCMFLYMSLTAVNNPMPLSTQALNQISGMIVAQLLLVVDSWFTYRKRNKLPGLIKAEKWSVPLPGGRRSTDAPVDVG
jgi:hypothetical protein